jgi:hypothetical protein
LRCSGISGVSQATQGVVKTLDLPPFGTDTITWLAADFFLSPPTFPSDVFGILCQVPPGVSLNDSRVFFTEEVGF